MTEHSINSLLQIMRDLRNPETGCPWDKEQSIESIAPYSVEEIYELMDAIERDDMDDIKDELGDLLFHIVFYARLAEEDGHFEFNDVVNSVCEKLRYRHPHVFGDMQLATKEQVAEEWEKRKQKERESKKKTNHKPDSLLDNVPRQLPATIRADKLQKRAATVGFEWPELQGVIDKLEEELAELKEAINENNQDNMEEELGDYLFSVVNLARRLSIDSEAALSKTNQKFIRRFQYIEEQARNTNRTLDDMSLEEMDAYWDEAKKMGACGAHVPKGGEEM